MESEEYRWGYAAGLKKGYDNGLKYAFVARFTDLQAAYERGRNDASVEARIEERAQHDEDIDLWEVLREV